jgi:hypothetical protein
MQIHFPEYGIKIMLLEDSTKCAICTFFIILWTVWTFTFYYHVPWTTVHSSTCLVPVLWSMCNMRMENMYKELFTQNICKGNIAKTCIGQNYYENQKYISQCLYLIQHTQSIWLYVNEFTVWITAEYFPVIK